MNYISVYKTGLVYFNLLFFFSNNIIYVIRVENNKTYKVKCLKFLYIYIVYNLQ